MKALILVKETGAIDNAALRSITGLDTLAASKVLGHLCQQHKLIKKGGSGPSTYYQPAISLLNASEFESNASDLSVELKSLINALSPKARKTELWPLILQLCVLRPWRAQQLAYHLNRKVDHLKTNHLRVMRQEGLIDYVHREVRNHPAQAYTVTPKGKKWLGNPKT